MKLIYPILILIGSLLLCGCTGSKKYFKAAEALEKKGLVNEAAEYYLESLQRKPTSVDARVKLQSVGQKHVSNMSSDFFRNFNTQQTESSLESFEKLKDFTSKSAALNVVLDYPKSYEDDYQKSVESYCSKNYNQAYNMVNQKKYNEALTYITNIKKYNPNYKTTQQLETISNCEPLYQTAVSSLENKNYASALVSLSKIKARTENYKDFKELYELSSAEQTKEFILIQPKNSVDNSEKEIEEYLFNNFTQTATQKLSNIKLINNTPFEETNGSADLLSNNTNVDLIQAIRKATGADYFYTYDVSNKKELNTGPTKSSYTSYLEVKIRKNDTLVITEYQPVNYNLVKGSRTYSYDYRYKIINAFSNQIVSSQTQNMMSQDAMEYNEFSKSFNGNINNLFPYNPQQTAPSAQYNPRNWRSMFQAKNTLKSFDDLKGETNGKAINFFTSSVTNNIK
ncbi:MAG: hypothetical protein H0U95_00300 [Bacteroidetes bacterium]|nr:hypothetical protein [Bacteroidota bacterium]